MNDHPDTNSPQPRWQPYLYAAGVLAAFASLLIIGGLLGDSPYLEHAFFVLFAAGTVSQVFLRPARVPSLAGRIFCTAFFALASAGKLSQDKSYFGIGYGILAAIYFGLSIRTAVQKRRLRAEQSERLKRASETMGRVFRDGGLPERDPPD